MTNSLLISIVEYMHPIFHIGQQDRDITLLALTVSNGCFDATVTGILIANQTGRYRFNVNLNLARFSKDIAIIFP